MKATVAIEVEVGGVFDLSDLHNVVETLAQAAHKSLGNDHECAVRRCKAVCISAFKYNFSTGNPTKDVAKIDSAPEAVGESEDTSNEPEQT